MSKTDIHNTKHSFLPLKGAFYLVLLALMLFFAIYTATKFPYTYITMEGDDFWVLTKDFWHLKLGMLPAFTNWLADFLIQFYSSPWIAATIQALILGAIGLITHKILKAYPRGGLVGAMLRWLALLPPILLGYYCTFNLSFQLQWLFFFALLLIYKLIPNYKGKLLWSIISMPLGFLLMRTPLLFLLIVAPLCFTRRGEFKKAFLWGGLVGAFVLLALTPLAYSQQVAFIPFEERYMALGCQAEPITSKASRDGEYLKKLVCLANDERWEDLLYKEHVRRDAQQGWGVSLQYALLAESALGTLPENLLDYPIRDESRFLFQHQEDKVALQFNRLFYLNLGVYDEAFHQAMEYGLMQTNNNCFSSLRQMVDYSIEEGDWEIADKYLQILSKSSCHKGFVKERRAKMEEAKKTFKKDIQLRADNFIGGYPLPIEMLRLARYYQDEAQRKKMLDYAICSYMLRGDVNSFMVATQAFDIYKDKPLPKAYKAFLEAISVSNQQP